MARLTIETESDTTRRFLKFGLSECISILALIVSSVVALYVGLYQPFRERTIERQNDLLSYRNLACFSGREVLKHIPEIENRKKTDETEVDIVTQFLGQIKINELPEPSLVESFVDLTRISFSFKKWNEQKSPITLEQQKEMDLSKQAIKDDLEKIDSYIKKEYLPTEGLAGGCSSTSKP